MVLSGSSIHGQRAGNYSLRVRAQKNERLQPSGCESRSLEAVNDLDQGRREWVITDTCTCQRWCRQEWEVDALRLSALTFFCMLDSDRCTLS